MGHPDWTLAEWYEEAARCYVEEHQGCVWCGGENRVYRTERGGRIEYSCGMCEFYACQENGTGRYFVTPGSGHEKMETMYSF